MATYLAGQEGICRDGQVGLDALPVGLLIFVVLPNAGQLVKETLHAFQCLFASVQFDLAFASRANATASDGAVTDGEREVEVAITTILETPSAFARSRHSHAYTTKGAGKRMA